MADRAEAEGNVSELLLLRRAQVRVLVGRGQTGPARPLADWLVEAARESGGTEEVLGAFTAAAGGLLAAGEPDRALELLAEAAAWPHAAEASLYPACLPEMARTATDAGDPTLAQRLAAVTQTISVCRRSGQSVLRADGAGLTRATPGAGFSVHRGLPGQAGSYVHSPSVSGLRATPGDHLRTRLCQDKGSEVAGCVLVTVEHQPAALAPVGPLRQGQLGFHMPAARAGLRRRVEGVGLDERPARPGGLVTELAAQLPPARVGDAAGEAAPAQHPGDVQVLDHHRPIGAGQGAREVVQGVAAQVGDLGVRLGEPAAGLLPALGRLAAAAVGGEGPRRRASWRLRRRNRRCACWSGAGLGTRRPSDSTARWRMPTSTPTRQPGRCGPGTARCTWQVKLTNQRPPCRLMVAARIRAPPASMAPGHPRRRHARP